MNKERFVLQPSKEMQDGWVATAIRELLDWLREEHKDKVL